MLYYLFKLHDIIIYGIINIYINYLYFYDGILLLLRGFIWKYLLDKFFIIKILFDNNKSIHE